MTQATVSRDLDDIGAVKVRVPSGNTVYAIPEFAPDRLAPLDQLRRVMGEWVAEVSCSGNIVVLRTPPGCAHVVASALDRSRIDDYDAELWFRAMQVNLNAPFLLTQVCLPLLRRAPRASIVFTSDAVGRRGRAYWGAYAVAKAGLEGLMQVLADELDIPVHIHLHETASEVEESRARTGQRPLERLETLGLLSPALSAVHMTQLQDDEIARLAAAGASVVHCPESNLKLASGFCPVQKLRDAGVNVALGTDGAASNNDLDMLGEMRTAALLAKAVYNDAAALPAHAVLRMATLNGAHALGMGEETGSLIAGKWADIAAVDLGTLETQPLYDPVSQLVYAATRSQVTDVWVAGQHLLKNRALTQLETQDLLQRAHSWQARIAAGDSGA